MTAAPRHGRFNLACTAQAQLHNKLAEFVELVDPDAEAGQTTGVTFRIDDSVDAEHVTQ